MVGNAVMRAFQRRKTPAPGTPNRILVMLPPTVPEVTAAISKTIACPKSIPKVKGISSIRAVEPLNPGITPQNRPKTHPASRRTTEYGSMIIDSAAPICSSNC